ncbi:hypothetical protein GCM10009624_35560 [Gordonia sinesedis]
MAIESSAGTSADTGAGEGRRYAGADADQRRERRRAALVEAGLELFGHAGYAGVSVKRVCEEAGLTQRYFYESFNDRTGLLIAVYDECVGIARAATLDAAGEYLAGDAGLAGEDVPEVARAALGAFLAALASDPRRARVILVEVVGVDPLVERVRMDAIHGWADLILAMTRGDRPTSTRQRLAAVGLVGAVTQLLVDWYFGSVAPLFAGGNTGPSAGVDTGTGETEGADAAARSPSPAADPGDLETILDVCVDMFVATHQRLFAD